MLHALAQLGGMTRFVGHTAHALVHRPLPARALLGAARDEAFEIGLRSLPLLVIISVFIGTNLALQGYASFKVLGGEQLLGMFVARAGVRELAPLMVAAMVAAKAGTEMASQLAVMRIREQIDALEVMAVDPHVYLVVPRFLGIVAVLPALTVVSIAALILASWAAAVWQLGLPSHTFVELLFRTTSLLDLAVCGVKALLFGGVICVVSTFYGFYAASGPAGVGEATNKAVVVSAVACATLNYLVSAWVYA